MLYMGFLQIAEAAEIAEYIYWEFRFVWRGSARKYDWNWLLHLQSHNYLSQNGS
jgi:hypothetical protein